MNSAADIAKSSDWSESNDPGLLEEIRTALPDVTLTACQYDDAIRDGTTSFWLDRRHLLAVMKLLGRDLTKPFTLCFDITAIDETRREHKPNLAKDFTVSYHLLSSERNQDVRIKVALAKEDKSLPSVSQIWPNANWYEREVWDMFGVRFTEHPHLARILMPPTWQGHPLLKTHPARATEMPPFSLDSAKQQVEQEALKFNPEAWGMKRQHNDTDFMFLNLGPNHPSVHGAFRIVLQMDGEEIVDCVPDIGYHHRGG